MLRVRELAKTYPGGEEALTGVSFDVTGNEVVAIIGPSGAGKSTLIESINRLTEPTRGTVSLDGTELTDLSKRELRRARRDIAMIFQEYNLVERLTVMENVLSGRLGYLSTWKAFRRKFPKEDVEFARETLDRVGLGGHERDRADELSGGQRQRVGIARAVLQRPKIMLADEPTSSLDPETSRAVMELLTEIARDEDIPVLINIHEVDLALEYADRLIGLADGAVVFDGPPVELDASARDRIYRDGDPSESDSDPDRAAEATDETDNGPSLEKREIQRGLN
ncbi:phosphonate ABC transporter ATP-binding protein [Natronococcus sp. A-GB7]|uniref:phosphonate ABC transporter ATP-binding protein n=1 Tax=Natronococcus sp. A-GB7 TaxID=3037649 RepID=UPI00241BFD31|nr:phosphonate ABC transporter ATP-binding protein [Natronococcus sp. A-GB7]MDG5818245.1 phosphonate ABC transporter ATP-binding protein [Natronococcus sp. A-GB7]